MSEPAEPAGMPAADPPVLPDLTGRVLGDFHVLRRLGQGGMGQVYLAEQQSLKRKVALKILKPELARNAASLQRFEAEAKAVARATHANIVQVYAIGEGDGVHYIALEYVEGLNLREYLARKGPPPLPLALTILKQVAAALARADELGIIHRDVKPDNILLTRKGEVKVTDFGLSRCFQADPNAVSLTQSGVTMGTPLYMSPEQVEGKPVDARADIYSFGATAYHLLTGQPPFRGETPFEVALKHVNEQPQPLRALRPDLPAELEAVVTRMMAKQPEGRFATCREVLRAVNRLRDRASSTVRVRQTAVTPAVPMPAPPTAAAIRRRAALVGLSLLTAALAGAVVAWKVDPDRAPTLGSMEEGDSEPVPLTTLEEEYLKKQAALYAEPGSDPVLRETGYRFFYSLGLAYLEQDSWPEARDLFDRLARNPQGVPTYEALGQLGGAVVLAFEDRPAESNALVLDYVKRIDAQSKTGGLLNNPRVRAQLARALERNAVNLEANATPFPPELELLRKPQHYTPGDSTRKKDK